jgi:hypothetical protein
MKIKLIVISLLMWTLSYAATEEKPSNMPPVRSPLQARYQQELKEAEAEAGSKSFPCSPSIPCPYDMKCVRIGGEIYPVGDTPAQRYKRLIASGAWRHPEGSCS